MACECNIPTGGAILCKRHDCRKNARMVELCRLGAAGQQPGLSYWDAWEAGIGPRQPATVRTRSHLHSPTYAQEGPGTELKRLLKRLSILGTGRCGCNSMAAKMDRWGPDGCREPENRAEILDQMQKEAAKRKLPFVRTAADGLVEFAIRKAEWGSRPGIPL